MTTENTKLAVHTIVNDYDEDVIREMIHEQMYEYIDGNEIEEYGSLDDAYNELGRGEAENDVINDVIKGCGVKLNTDEHIEVVNTLCEIWMISVD